MPVVDDPLDALFRCEKWACTLAEKHCLRRQRETRAGGGNQKTKTIHPAYPHCASGECAQGVAIAARHPGFTVEERQDHKKAPRLDVVLAAEEGTEMPKGYRRGQACKTCSSRGTKHLMGCKEASAAPAARVKPADRVEKIRAAATKAKAPRPAAAVEEPVGINERVERMSLDELLVWRGLIENQLAARERVLEEQLVEVRRAIRASKGATAEAA